MLRKLGDIREYIDFINEINSDADFGDPMLRTEEQLQCNLFTSVSKPSNQVFGVFDGEKIIGLFVFLILEEESYIEMLVGLSKNRDAYEEMFDFLKEKYPGYQADFVYNPGNFLLHGLMVEEKAEFEKEQQRMVLKKEVSYSSSHRVELYSPNYREQYVAMHSPDGYWTADKVIDAQDRFRIILALEQDEVVGYIDITHKFEENEPYDVLVKEEHRRKGHAKAMLAKAIELNRPKGMMLLVDVDNDAAIRLYESMGFVKVEGENNVTAHVGL